MAKLCFCPTTVYKSLLPIVHDRQVVPPLLGACISTLYLVWVISEWPRSQPAIPQIASTDTIIGSDPTTEAKDYLQIASWHLMGEIDTVEAADTILVATPLQLKLIGIFYLPGQPQHSYAVIQSVDGVEQKYRIGETLPEGATLHAVERNRVVLKHHQRLEYLQFEVNPSTLRMSADQSIL